MTHLIAEGTVTVQTMVWRQGMVNWVPAGRTELASLLAGGSPAPPPLTGESVDNTIAWTIAFCPLLFPFITAMLGPALQQSALAVWLVPLAIYVVLVIADERRLKDAGHDTRNMVTWGIVLIPVYLFMRASRLKQNYAYAVLWLVTFVVSLFL